jgi:hypothetical protein
MIVGAAKTNPLPGVMTGYEPICPPVDKLKNIIDLFLNLSVKGYM